MHAFKAYLYNFIVGSLSSLLLCFLTEDDTTNHIRVDLLVYYMYVIIMCAHKIIDTRIIYVCKAWELVALT